MATLIDKINKFESLRTQNVFEFNKIFIGSEITQGRLEWEVVIGDILGPENVREVFVNAVSTRHVFVIQTGVPTLSSEFNFLDKGKGDFRLNSVLEEKEMELEPVEYMMLQYFRGCQNTLHTQVEIALKLKKSSKGIRNSMKSMEKKNILKAEVIPQLHKIAVTINEDWL